MKYVRLFPDADGESHFADEEMELEAVEYAPPAPLINVSRPCETTGLAFLSSPPGWFGDWHPAPRRQFILCLRGEIEVQASDREVRRFQAGSIILVEDTTGRGHTTRIVSPTPALLAAVPTA